MLRTKGYTPSYNCEYWLVSLTTQRYSPFLRGAVLRPPMRLESGKVFSTPTPTTLCPRGTLVGEDTEHRLDPALFGNAKASEESRMAASEDCRGQEPILNSMGDI
jgi:hypothetical protein